MESNCVSLGTARKLKATEFPQTTAYRWCQNDWGIWYLKPAGEVVVPSKLWRDEAGAATAQEIADQLPPTTVVYIFKERLRNGYSARYRLDPALNWTMVDGPTMAEALAALYLRLNEGTN